MVDLEHVAATASYVIAEPPVVVSLHRLVEEHGMSSGVSDHFLTLSLVRCNLEYPFSHLELSTHERDLNSTLLIAGALIVPVDCHVEIGGVPCVHGREID